MWPSSCINGRRVSVSGLIAAILAAATVQASRSQNVFDLHNGFWINLDCHLLKMSGQTSGEKPEVKDALEDQERLNSVLPSPYLSPELIVRLEQAAPVYRKDAWPSDRARNARWIHNVNPLLRRYSGSIARDLAAVYKTPWPQEPIRVDVAEYANWSGAYTTLRPTRILISSVDARNQDTQGLEVLFHEASHSLIERLQNALSEECRRQHCFLPRRDLWHAVLFYTTGEIVRRHVSGHVPYAERNHLWEGQAWPMYISALKKDWQPYLDGKLSFEIAISSW